MGSDRKGQYGVVEAVEAPDPDTVVFRLKWATVSFLASVASPWNFIYKADILAKDPHWYETHIMGTGPFTFVEHVKGSHWVGKKNPNYWDKGKPYLDGYRAIFHLGLLGPGRGGARRARAHPVPRLHAGRSRHPQGGPRRQDHGAGEPWDCVLMVAINHKKKPFDDKRVRRALTLALDRYEGSKALSKIAIVKEVAGVQVPGTPFATPPDELAKLAGYWKDINASRAEARKLLKEAGAEGFSFTFTNRGMPMPYEPLACG